MFPDLLPKLNLILGVIVAVFLSFGTGFITGDIHRGGADKENQEIAVAKANDVARAQEQKMDAAQSTIEKSTLGEKNAIEAKRNQFIVSINAVGLRPSNSQLPASAKASLGIGGQALRLSGQNAIDLENFASDCAITEAERNEAILKYEALTQ